MIDGIIDGRHHIGGLALRSRPLCGFDSFGLLLLPLGSQALQ
jgi:hypothetical protein